MFIIISIVIDVSMPLLPSPNLFFFQMIQIFIGVIIIGLGSGFYLIANLGPGPRDGLMTGLQKLTKFSTAFIRSIIEIIVVIIGWYLGGVVGLGTIIFAFGVGPFVSFGYFYSKRILLIKIYFI